MILAQNLTTLVDFLWNSWYKSLFHILTFFKLWQKQQLFLQKFYQMLFKVLFTKLSTIILMKYIVQEHTKLSFVSEFTSFCEKNIFVNFQQNFSNTYRVSQNERAPTSGFFRVLKWFHVTQMVIIPKEGFISFKRIFKFQKSVIE